MRIGPAIAELQRAELALAEAHRTIGHRHAAEQDVFHICQTLAAQCHSHAEQLASAAKKYPEVAEKVGEESWSGLMPEISRRLSTAVAGVPQTSLLLLRDLRRLFLQASQVSILYVELAQGAQAVRDAELLRLVGDLHPETLLQVKWATTRIKELAPIVLATG